MNRMFREKDENFSGKQYEDIFLFLDGMYIQEIENFLSQYEGETEVVISTSIEAIKRSETMESTPPPSSEDCCHC